MQLVCVSNAREAAASGREQKGSRRKDQGAGKARGSSMQQPRIAGSSRAAESGRKQYRKQSSFWALSNKFGLIKKRPNCGGLKTWSEKVCTRLSVEGGYKLSAAGK